MVKFNPEDKGTTNNYIVSSNPTTVDKANDLLIKATPVFHFRGKKLLDVGALIPEQYFQMGENKCYLRQESTEEAYKKLPKNPDGTINTELIAEAREIAIHFIKESNKKATEKMEHGIWKEQINNFNPATLVLSPEVVHALETAGVMKDYSTGAGLQDIPHIDVLIKAFGDNDETQALEDIATTKSSQEINANIAAQNKALDELAKIDLSKPENIQRFLQRYKEITGTSFSYAGIFNAVELSNSDADAADKLRSSVANFGIQQNMIDATKNAHASDIYFSVLKNTSTYLVSKLGLPGKIVGGIIPYQMETAETLTKGAKEGEYINTEQITYENLATVTMDGTRTALLQNFLGGFSGVEKFGTRFLLKSGFSLSWLAGNAGWTKEPETTLEKTAHGAANPLYQTWVVGNFLFGESK